MSEHLFNPEPYLREHGMTNRRFGVEIEFSTGGNYDYDDLREKLYSAGLDWRLGADGSEWEVCTPILQGSAGLRTLAQALQLLRNLGGYVTEEDGLHVHHDAPEFINDMEAIIRLVRSWHANQEAIWMMVDPSRRDYRDVCPAWDNENIVSLERNRYPADHYRNDLNIASLSEHGTIEIRLHEGTLDYDEAEAWVLFGQSFIESVLADHRPTPELGSTDALLDHIRLGEKSGAFLKAKAARSLRSW